MKRRKVLWLDCETTGVDYELHDIWQLAYLIEIDEEVEEEGKLLIRPYNIECYTEEALDAGNTTIKELEKLDFTIADAIFDLKLVLGKYVNKFKTEDKFVIAGYNVSFDRNFVYTMFQKAGDRYGLGSWCFWPVRDVVTYLADYILNTGVRFPNYQLKTVCNRLGIEFEAHDAMEDIKATRQLYYMISEIKEVL